MLQPPQNGNVYDLVPPGTTNAEAVGILIAWDAWQTFSGTVLDDALNQLQALGGILA